MSVELEELKRTSEELAVETAARARYSSADPEAGAASTQFRANMHWYDPRDGDQWPDDLDERPDKVHLTMNIVKPAVDVASRIQSILPRLSLRPKDPRDQNSRNVAEAVEKMFAGWWQETEPEIWLNDACRTKSIVGRTFLKPFWNSEDKRPDVSVIEQPHRLRIGWRSSDYKKMDWAIFEYSISPLEAMLRWPHIKVTKSRGETNFTVEVSDHTDPLNTIPNHGFQGVYSGGGSSPGEEGVTGEYQRGQAEVWDYWYKKIGDDGKAQICNAMLLEGVVVDGPNVHSEYNDIPYIPIENDHRPGSPLGISDVKALLDLQDGMNRVFSHLTQMVADNSDPAWQLLGENATHVEPGMLPLANEVVAPGAGNRIDRVDTGINTFPVDQLINQYWDMFHKVTGLTEALFGGIPGAQTSGRALAVQIEAAGNRLGPRRDRLYASIRTLFKFWRFMLEAQNATITIYAPSEEQEAQPEQGQEQPEQTQMVTQEMKLAPLFKEVGLWKIIAPEVTPRDVAEHIMNVINKVQAKLSSLKSGMDEIGEESPEDMVREVVEERNDADLFPADVQTKVAVMSLLQQLQAQAQQQEQMSALAESQSASNQLTNENMSNTPAMGPEEGGEMAGLPMSQQGAPGGAGLPDQQTLLRADQGTGQVDNLQQISIRP